MKLKKGDKVEVMNKNEAPVSWRIAEILSGNGHTYHLKYDSYPGMASQHNVEAVSRKYVRPCQPSMQGVEDFIVGDTVEVFYECAWKTAAILKVLQGKRETKSKKISVRAAAVQNRYYLVRLLGGSAEPMVDGSKIRTKLTWHDDKWILFEKSSQKNRLNILDESQCMDSHHDSRLLKRVSPYTSSINEALTGRTQKLRAIEKDGRKQRQAVASNLDAVSHPKEMLGEKNMHESLNATPTGSKQMVQAKINDIREIRNSQLNSSDSDASSVGSCSVADRSPNNLDTPSAMILTRETDAVCSDAESGSGSGFERRSNSLPPVEEVEMSIRRLELLAYRRTLEALYASGPLSWEQESMLTNLRIMLHISNDEHLTELKYLISAKTAIYQMIHMMTDVFDIWFPAWLPEPQHVQNAGF